MGKRKHRKYSLAGTIGFCGLLAILFIALKLTGEIDWNWLWVVSPIWILPAIPLCAVVVSLLMTLLLIAGILLVVLCFGLAVLPIALVIMLVLFAVALVEHAST